MSAFDADAFLGTEYNQPTDTTMTPVPPKEYTGQVDKIVARQVNTQDGERIVMDVHWQVLDEGVEALLGMKKVVAKQGIFLDLTLEGAIDMSKGKNRQLGLVREAVGQNKSGKPWNPNMLVTKTAKINVINKVDTNDKTLIHSNVDRVVALA